MNLPTELVAFLRNGGQLRYDPAACEAGKVTLHALSELSVKLFPTDVQGTEIAEDDPHKGELGCYLVPAVDLTATAEGYEPAGLLLWFPIERRFGVWDSSHPWLALFAPGVSWPDIEMTPQKFINAQWHGAFDDSARLEPLVPWHRHAYHERQLYEPV